MTAGNDSLIGTTVLGLNGQVLGTVTALLVDPRTVQGRWLQIELADVAMPRRAVLPLASASLTPAGALATPWNADTVAEAPTVGEQISPNQTQALNHHYGLDL